MRRFLLIVAVVLVVIALTGCGLIPQRYKSEPVPAQCDAMCYVPCISKDGDTGIRVEGDPYSAHTWDEIGSLLAGTVREKIEQCDARRESCVKCLQRLKKEKVITLP